MKVQMKTILLAAFALVCFSMMPSAQADRCEGAFIKILPNVEMPAGTREVVLEPGDQVWDNYTCASCDILTSMRPNKLTNNQECPNCGVPHTKEPTQPPEHFMKDGRIHLLQSQALIEHGDPTGVFARSGKGWTCSYCTQTNFQVEVSCPGCGGEAPKALITPGRFKNYTEANPSNSGSTLGAASLSAAPFFTTAKAVGPATPLSIQNPNKKAFLKTKTGMMLMSAAVSGAIGFVWWGTQAYTLPAEVTNITANTAYVTYVDTSGKSITLDFTPGAKEATIKTWRVGDKLTLHFRNLGGVKGGEAFDGSVVVPAVPAAAK